MRSVNPAGFSVSEGKGLRPLWGYKIRWPNACFPGLKRRQHSLRVPVFIFTLDWIAHVTCWHNIELTHLAMQ